jgi:hypothetical protein
MRSRSDGLSLISLYHFLCGLLNLLAMCGILTVPLTMAIVAAAAARDAPDTTAASAIIGILGLLCGVLFVLLAVANVVVGWGLWHLRPWARTGAFVLAALRLINIPVGTVIGAVIIWYLLQEKVKAEFVASSGEKLTPNHD